MINGHVENSINSSSSTDSLSLSLLLGLPPFLSFSSFSFSLVRVAKSNPIEKLNRLIEIFRQLCARIVGRVAHAVSPQRAYKLKTIDRSDECRSGLSPSVSAIVRGEIDVPSDTQSGRIARIDDRKKRTNSHCAIGKRTENNCRFAVVKNSHFSHHLLSIVVKSNLRLCVRREFSRSADRQIVQQAKCANACRRLSARPVRPGSLTNDSVPINYTHYHIVLVIRELIGRTSAISRDAAEAMADSRAQHR